MPTYWAGRLSRNIFFVLRFSPSRKIGEGGGRNWTELACGRGRYFFFSLPPLTHALSLGDRYSRAKNDLAGSACLRAMTPWPISVAPR